MSRLIHLVRHGEVDNPAGVVYAGLDGFPLSERGRAEAAEAAHALERREVSRVVTSPLERAVQTAEIVAALGDIPIEVDPRLTEWHLSTHWAGIPWADLTVVRPGELEAYLAHPWDLPFSPEALSELAARMEAAIVEHHGRWPAEVVFVSHQDPIQAARLALTGRPLEHQHDDKPEHACVVTLAPGDRWSERSMWCPGDRDDGSSAMS